MHIWIIDTNVLVSGLISRDPEAPTASVLNDMLTGRLIFVLSPALLAEYRAVLLRPRICERHGLNESDIDQILIELTANAKWSEPDNDPDHQAPDQGDAHLWALLHEHPAAILMTGDRLLIDNPRPGSRVVSPTDYRKDPEQMRSVLNQTPAHYKTTGSL